MARDRPDATNLLETVRDFLEELMPTLEGEARFHTRVSIHLLDIVRRELGLAEGFERAEQRSLETLLGHSGELEALQRELAQAIRNRGLDDRREAVFEHVLRTVENKLRIVRPGRLG